MIDAGDPGLEILHAYTVQANLRQLLALSGTNPERAIIRARLWRQYGQAAASPSPGVHRFAATIEAWWPAIEAAITTDHSNATIRGLQPPRETPSPQRLRLPQRPQPPPRHTPGGHSSTHRRASAAGARSRSMSRHACRPSRKGNILLNQSEGDQLA